MAAGPDADLLTVEQFAAMPDADDGPTELVRGRVVGRP